MGFKTLAHQRAYMKEYRKKNSYKKKKALLNKKWIANNRERYNAMKLVYRIRTKRVCMEHYGNGKIECKKCGEEDIDVLCLDHIDDNGAEHRKEIGISGRSSAGTGTYEALRREGYPDGMQILCANCNMKKEQERKRKNREKNIYYKHYLKKEDARHNNSI